MTFVLLPLLLGQGESLFADQGRKRHLDPILSGQFVVGAIAARPPRAFPQPSREALPRTELGLPQARPAPVRRVAQYAPHRGSLPAGRLGSGWNMLLVQQACNGVMLSLCCVYTSYTRRTTAASDSRTS